MPYYVTVESVRSGESHEAGFVEWKAAQLYAQDVLAVYLQRLAKDTRHTRREKDILAARLHRWLAEEARLTVPAEWVALLGLRSITLT